MKRSKLETQSAEQTRSTDSCFSSRRWRVWIPQRTTCTNLITESQCKYFSRSLQSGGERSQTVMPYYSFAGLAKGSPLSSRAPAAATVFSLPHPDKDGVSNVEYLQNMDSLREKQEAILSEFHECKTGFPLCSVYRRRCHFDVSIKGLTLR